MKTKNQHLRLLSMILVAALLLIPLATTRVAYASQGIAGVVMEP